MFELFAFRMSLPYLVGFLVWLGWLAQQQYNRQADRYGFVGEDFRGKRGEREIS